MLGNTAQEFPVVLCVDDDPGTQQLVRSALAAFGCTVLGAATGPAALRLMEKHHVDVLVCDAELPDMPGAEVISAVHLIAPHVRSILLTAQYGEEGTATEAINVGRGDHLVSKPFAAEVICRAVQTVLSPQLESGRRARVAEAEREMVHR